MSGSWSTKFNAAMEYLWGTTSLTVTPSSVVTQQNVTVQFTTNGIPVTWSSSSPSVATIDSSGLATVVGDSGSTTITVTSIANPGVTATAVITISGSIVKRIEIRYV